MEFESVSTQGTSTHAPLHPFYLALLQNRVFFQATDQELQDGWKKKENNCTKWLSADQLMISMCLDALLFPFLHRLIAASITQPIRFPVNQHGHTML